MALILPNTLTNGTTADASQVQANFAAVKTAVDAIVAPGETVIQTIVNGGTGPITFSSIPATYNHLRIVASVRSARTTAGADTGLRMYFNGSTSSVYGHTFVVTGAGAPSGGGSDNNGFFYLGQISANGSGGVSTAFAAVVIDIPSYKASGRWRAMTTHILTDAAGGLAAFAGGGRMKSTSAVSSIKLDDDVDAGLASGSTATLLGIA